MRHGRVAWNSDGRQASFTDVPLDDEGQAQAAAVGQMLAGEPVDRIIVSPMTRCQQTAAAIAVHHPNAPLTTDQRLRELHFGPFEGQRADDLLTGPMGDAFRAWRSETNQVTPDGGEELAACAARMGEVLEQLPDGLSVLVSHGVSGRILLATAVLDLPPIFYRRLWLDNATVSEVVWDGALPRLQRLNEHPALA